MKVLIAPLNWGLGHATRCLPLIVRYLRAGDEVVLAGDSESLLLLRKHFPALRYYKLAPLRLRYGKGRSQVGAMLRALPRLLFASVQDHAALGQILNIECFDLIISDNRFGLYAKGQHTVYITHQLRIPLPPAFRFMEPFVQHMHGRVIRRFTECWVPDYADQRSLAGRLTHTAPLPANVRYIGPLSRFEYVVPQAPETAYDAVAVLSGLEPQRTLFEEQLLQEYKGRQESLLLIRGKMSGPNTAIRKGNILVVPRMEDADLAGHLLHARTIISRSGYSSLMDYAVLGLFDKQKRGEVTLRLVPTPGQPEQEYLSERFS